MATSADAAAPPATCKWRRISRSINVEISLGSALIAAAGLNWGADFLSRGASAREREAAGLAAAAHAERRELRGIPFLQHCLGWGRASVGGDLKSDCSGS
ncbi:hypothetical protein SKAU_G00146120 [Synaphobranchus kaupii]|uniref:Uncharacterized protein n=1 Tax=Synaphobranchus kaupii TaxID=118154 RepID=A0A9Q1J4G5_SYNKA|nr:hypothetical protein SKAU_G00146120 [Synaphobranchus kaupii]